MTTQLDTLLSHVGPDRLAAHAYDVSVDQWEPAIVQQDARQPNVFTRLWTGQIYDSEAEALAAAQTWLDQYRAKRTVRT